MPQHQYRVILLLHMVINLDSFAGRALGLRIQTCTWYKIFPTLQWHIITYLLHLLVWNYFTVMAVPAVLMQVECWQFQLKLGLNHVLMTTYIRIQRYTPHRVSHAPLISCLEITFITIWEIVSISHGFIYLYIGRTIIILCDDVCRRVYLKPVACGIDWFNFHR